MPWLSRRQLANSTQMFAQMKRDRDDALLWAHELEQQLFVWRAHYRFDPTVRQVDRLAGKAQVAESRKAYRVSRRVHRSLRRALRRKK